MPVSLQMLEGKHMIRFTREIVLVIDRPALETETGYFNGLPETELGRLVTREAACLRQPTMQAS